LARVELSDRAVQNLTRLMQTHSLPTDTPRRLQRSLRPLRRFPLAGAPLDGRWEGFRFVLGPWRWMVIIYAYFEDEDRVIVATIVDGRAAPSSASG
jgi:hypothetical protein